MHTRALSLTLSLPPLYLSRASLLWHMAMAPEKNEVNYGKCFVGYHVPIVLTYIHDLLQVSPCAPLPPTPPLHLSYAHTHLT